MFVVMLHKLHKMFERSLFKNENDINIKTKSSSDY